MYGSGVVDAGLDTLMIRPRLCVADDRQDRLGPHHRSPQVDANYVPPVVDRDVGESTELRDPGIVDQHRGGGPRRPRCGAQSRRPASVADVADDDLARHAARSHRVAVP